MRKISISLAIAAFALSMSAQDLDKIINDHYKASGQEKLSNIGTVCTKGKVVAMGMESPITMYQSRPGKLRTEMNIMGQKMIQTFNGKTGWLYAPAMGITSPQAMGGDELKSIASQAEINSPLWDYKARGNKAELAGSSADGSAHRIKITTAEGDEMTVSISKETSLISSILTNQVVNGMENEIEIKFKDYKPVKGIPAAHYMAVEMGGQPISTFTFESIEYDRKLDAALFEKPGVE